MKTLVKFGSQHFRECQSAHSLRMNKLYLSPSAHPCAAFVPVPVLTHSFRRRLVSTKKSSLSEARCCPTMLRVQKKRLPEDWDKKMSTLSGRFLPMDLRDENILNILESTSSLTHPFDEENYGPEGPPSHAYGHTRPGAAKKWSKRSEAARKRWADPAYRAKVLEKRAEKRRKDAELAGEPLQPKQHKVEIGCMDSIALCDDEKAKAINDYARSNKLRSEKISAFHRDRQLWMENRLSKGRPKLTDEEYIEQKKGIQAKRKEEAFRRARVRRENKLKLENMESNGEASASSTDKPH